MIQLSLKHFKAKHFLRHFSLNQVSYTEYIKIGDVSKSIRKALHPQFVPRHYLDKKPNQTTLQHLQWMLKKDLLGQDMFLIGVPGTLRMHLVLQYLEMTNREMEYIALTRDTTENDLKQRREVFNGTAHYVDQSAVCAATHGRVLVLDGIEKAERNVLPVLNNLLENREMQLEDGRFLISPERYDKLLLDHSEDELKKWKLVRVSEDFRIIALGLPIPLFRGNPLDPPFRSRFQSRHIEITFEELLTDLTNTFGNISKDELKNFLSACYTFLSPESANLQMPKFPVENVSSVIKIINAFPSIPFHHVFSWLYPHSVILQKEGQDSLLKSLKEFSLYPRETKLGCKLVKIEERNNGTSGHVLEMSTKGKKQRVAIMGGNNIKNYSNFVPNSYHESVLENLLLAHSSGDFCLIGSRGTGKATLVRQFASRLNYSMEMMMLYNDMTARDLLQQRTTDEEGNTVWRSSQLVKAAIEGKLLVLDGLHRLHHSTLSVLQNLIHNREIQLNDGTRLLRHDRYEELRKDLCQDDGTMFKNKLLRIHPSFRIVALAEQPTLQSSKNNWMTPELLSMFLFHTLRPLSMKEEESVIRSMAGTMNQKMKAILEFTHELRNSNDDALKNVSNSFSTRQLVRLAKRLAMFPDEDIYNLLTQSCLMTFLPQLTKQAVSTVLHKCGINKRKDEKVMKEIYSVDNELRIGNTRAPIYNPGSSKVKVPDILFYNSPEHINIMEAMLQDFLLGDHLLLVGNQGVGKNKITDRFLQLLNRPREYIQLHRDTTVQSLTQQPTVVDGKIVYEDSPLLRAVQHGRVLVVDEADKAPTHVTSILKALVVSGEMQLSDGRCIVHSSDFSVHTDSSTVVMHPDFQMIVLANRPGFPFLGNDFFTILGDIFSCHAVDNPSYDAEISMLRQYGPNVPQPLIYKLANIFGELRSMSDLGLIAYPYSTREIVNVIKHIEKFPNEGIPHVLKNVFDFDAYSAEMKETINEIFRKHGLPTENQPISVKVAKKYSLPKPALSNIKIESTFDSWISDVSSLKYSSNNMFHITKEKLNVTEMRSNVFSEETNHIELQLKHNDIPLGITSLTSESSDVIYVATANPVSVYMVDLNQMFSKSINLSNYFPVVRSGFRPDIKISHVHANEDNLLILHEKSSNQTFVINFENGIVSRINIKSLFEKAIAKISGTISSKSSKDEVCMRNGFPSSSKLVLFSKNDTNIALLDFKENLIFQINSPETVSNILILDENVAYLMGKENKYVLDISDKRNWLIRTLKNSNFTSLSITDLKTIQPNELILKDLDINNEAQLLSIASSEHYACFLSGSIVKDNDINMVRFPRDDTSGGKHITMFPQHLVKFVSSQDLPSFAKVDSKEFNSGFLEVVDLRNRTVSFIEISMPHTVSNFANWLADSSEQYLLMCATTSGKLLTIDARGCIRRWEIDSGTLENSFQVWKKVAGVDDQQQLTIERVSGDAVSSPKHGKVDPIGAPHVGGNTWAGGTGGRDTAGLGGKGGPYRLDAGHNVFQVSEAEKDAVPEEVKRAAREMGRKAFKKRLKEIEMSEYDANLYDQFFGSVEKQVKSLRVILDGLQAKSKERHWLRHQTSGELDDTKLIEGITGEKSIYKLRGDQEPEMGAPYEKPKFLRLVVDVSGSMYRFNGHDNRLQRELESVILVMEAFDGYEDRFKFDIVGHSGEDFNILFSTFDKPPKNRKERLDLLRNMHAHSQFCMSGDNTLEAADNSLKTITNEEADEYFVIILSDANFDRYGISPTSFGKLLVSNPKVNAFAIFIGSLGNQAEIVSKHLPAGRGFVCFDSSNLTPILQKIFTSALLRD